MKKIIIEIHGANAEGLGLKSPEACPKKISEICKAMFEAIKQTDVEIAGRRILITTIPGECLASDSTPEMFVRIISCEQENVKKISECLRPILEKYYINLVE